MSDDTITIEDCAEFYDESSVLRVYLDSALLDLGINLGKGQEEHIIVRVGDTPEGIAEAFCLNHKLGPKQRAMLIEQIRKAMCEELKICEDISENVDDEHESFNNKIPCLNTRLKRRNEVNKKLVQRQNMNEDKENLNMSNMIKGQSKDSLTKTSRKKMDLYERGMVKKATIKKTTKNYIEQKIQEEMKELTFKPSINQNNSIQKSKKKIEDRFFENYEMVKEKKARIKEKVMKDWEAQHPFQPTINQEFTSRSGRSMRRTLSEKSLGSVRFTYLFEDAKRRKEVKEKEVPIDTECTFKPDTNLTKNFKQGMSTKTSRRKSRLELTSEFSEEQSLYRPKTGRPPKHRSKSKSESIGDYLYNLRNTKPKEKVEKNSSVINTSFVRDKSNQIVERLRKGCFRTIFYTLDSDCDGVINIESIDLNLLPEEIGKVYRVVLEEYKKDIDIDDFIKISSNLFQCLSIPQKNAFTQFHKSLESSKVSSNEESLFMVLVI